MGARCEVLGVKGVRGYELAIRGWVLGVKGVGL